MDFKKKYSHCLKIRSNYDPLRPELIKQIWRRRIHETHSRPF